MTVKGARAVRVQAGKGTRELTKKGTWGKTRKDKICGEGEKTQQNGKGREREQTARGVKIGQKDYCKNNILN